MQQGGPPYGVPPPEISQVGSSVTEKLQQMAEAAAPISCRPPPPTTSNADELVAGNFADEDGTGAGEEAERGTSGNRWPRQETLALIKIRSDMDGTFRDPGTLKGPLWDEVARKLGEEGYTRSAKKCKEKFENVHKYYKRTKDKCHDGKTYRFFSQLEALTHSSPAAAASLPPPTPTLPTATAAFGSRMTGKIQPTPISAVAPAEAAPPASAADPGIGGSNFLSNTSSSSSSDSEGTGGGRKRKQGDSGGGSDRRMKRFFKGLMKEVMERQEAMQKLFLEAIEKREQDRVIREEAWKRQEMARLAREHEAVARDRAVTASRDAAIVSFLQNITGQSVHIPHPIVVTAAAPQPAVKVPVVSQKQQRAIPSPQAAPPKIIETPRAPPGPTSMLVPVQENNQEVGFGLIGVDPMSSRWPKLEIDVLIKLRSEMEHRYQEAGPKGPLWEEISTGMRRLGYNRSAKRCKEKWENINKYYKKVKESNKKRPEDAKTCPYFHQLDALYRNKVIGGGSGSGSGGGNGSSMHQDLEGSPVEVRPVTTLPPPTQQPPVGVDGGDTDACGFSQQKKTSSEEETTKPEGTLKEPKEHDHSKIEEEHESDADTMDDGDDEDEDEEQQKMAYKIEFQRQNVGTTPATNDTRNQPTPTATTTTASFMAMVQ